MPFMLFGKLFASPDDTEEAKLKCWNDFLKNKEGNDVVTYTCIVADPFPPLLAQPINFALPYEPPQPPVPPNGHENQERPREFPIEKDLESSDVGELSRLLLNKKMLEKYVVKPYFNEEQKSAMKSKNGLEVKVYDVDTRSENNLVLKLLVNSSNCYELINKWRKKFVVRRGLRKGDRIGMYWHKEDKRFYFSVLKRANPSICNQ